ncbi:MAG: NAD(P)/FAD-dependent oxidoreductase [Candidatus Binatia bacterium]
MTLLYDIAIIGAGAAGLATGIFAAETARANGLAARIVLLDSARKIGAKILVSGGGRCNVTHDEISPEDFNGSRNIVRNILAAFDEQATVRWFTALGVPLKREETGKLFPVSDSARSVLDALLRRCAELEVTILPQHRVVAIRPLSSALPLAQEGKALLPVAQQSLFAVQHEHGEATARSVVLATGGCSLPKTGSDGSGWKIVQRLGHTISKTVPALVPLVLRTEMFHATLSGISQPVELSVLANGKVIDRRTGSLLWTHFGISGPVVMDASRHWVSAHANGQTAELRGSFLPGQRFEEVEAWLIATAKTRPRVSVGKVLAERLPDRLVLALARASEVEPNTLLSQLSRSQRRALVHKLTAFVFPVERDRGWNFAEVTAGGVLLSEVDYRTMESRKVQGLYLVGEMLDCDGRIGGFNFQWAWATGYLAGRAIGGKARPNSRAS